MKKIIYISLFLVLLLGITSCGKKEENLYNFKEEYESLNNQENDYGQKTRALDIPENNPFVKVEASEIVKMMDDKKTFVVYFGFASCPWCRSVLNELINASKEKNINTIYYVDVKDIRNTLKYNEETNKVEETKKGSDDYYKLLEKLDNVLSYYDLSTQASFPEVDAKRIYAPNIVIVEKGKAIGLESGIPESLTNPYMELTEEMKEDIKNKFLEVLKPLENSSVCSPSTGC